MTDLSIIIFTQYNTDFYWQFTFLKDSIAWATEIEVAEKNAKKFSLFAHSYCAEEQTGSPNQCSLPDDTDTEVQLVNSGTQCDADPLQLENVQLKRELEEATEELKRYRWGVNKIKNNDASTKFYTGLPTFSIFLWLYDYLSSKSTRMTYWKGEGNSSSDRVKMYSSKLHPVDQLLAVLMRLKLGLFVQDLADRFNISVASFSMYFTTWINLLHLELKLLNPFPARDIIDITMPLSFKSKYKSTRVIIDCTEIYIQRSTSLVNQSLTFSNYKHHNTLKFLVGITPCGVISFVSEAWGGRVSDRQLTAECGLLDLLEPGDSVMADKGFTISDLLEKRKCRLNIPPFRGNSDQFSTEEVYQTQEIAQLRIHVERSIGRVKNFHLLDGVLPLSIAPLATQIFQVCCWLTNLDVPLVID